jgi:type II secretory pathway component GspD/PulD (secretin)
MGGMGGGMGGMGGGMGGGYGVGNWRSMYRAYQLIYTIQQTIEPETWYDEGGDGRIDQYGESKLIIWQTPEVHKQIKEFLDMLRADLGQQVAIEARFLLVDENFLEDIGIDTDFRLNLGGTDILDSSGSASDPSSKGIIRLGQNSSSHTIPKPTGISSTLGGYDYTSPALGMSTAFGNLDDFQVSFLIRATQMHKNSKQLTAPKAVVMNGESATMEVNTQRRIKSESELQTDTTTTDGVSTTWAYWDTELEDIDTGVRMSITPTITADKKYVILRISTYLLDLLSTSEGKSVGIVPGVGTVEDTYILPTQQITSIQTRVSVPDRGTVLLGGLTLTAEKEAESGTPILSKLPLLGRLFSNRSEVKDKQILLILVKPTIMLQEETEQDAISAMSTGK